MEFLIYLYLQFRIITTYTHKIENRPDVMRGKPSTVGFRAVLNGGGNSKALKTSWRRKASIFQKENRVGT